MTFLEIVFLAALSTEQTAQGLSSSLLVPIQNREILAEQPTPGKPHKSDGYLLSPRLSLRNLAMFWQLGICLENLRNA